MLVDTHCHLGDERFDEDRDAVMRRAREAGVGHVVVIADSAPATERAMDVARRFEISATAGVHPHEASSWSSEVAARIEGALDDPLVVAVGETGLDYHYDHAPRDVQRRAFHAQLALAAARGLPVIVHARDADDDMAAMLADLGTDAPIVLHSFSSGDPVLDAGLAFGAYFGFSGMVTFRNWRRDEVVRRCPADRLLLETDAPHLAPVPHRGARNEPSFLGHVAAHIAEVRGVDVQSLATQTTTNAARCFGTPVAPPHHSQP